MIIRSVEFIGAFANVRDCPETELPEFAFIGRSNVGKSSLINMLCMRKGIAKVSNSPGKTQTLNFYLLNKAWYLVDLPGFGYAKVGKAKRADWSKEIASYIQKRPALKTVFMLVDLRIPPQRSDLSFIAFMGEMNCPFVLVFTKTDKMGEALINAQLTAFENEMLKTWESLPRHFLTSAVKGTGRDEILELIEQNV